MLNWLKNLFSDKPKVEEPSAIDVLRKSGMHRKPVPSRPANGSANKLPAQRADKPRPKIVREDTGTHDTLTIVDDSLAGEDRESGLDPYNTGQFDRSKSWDKGFGK